MDKTWINPNNIKDTISKILNGDLPANTPYYIQGSSIILGGWHNVTKQRAVVDIVVTVKQRGTIRYVSWSGETLVRPYSAWLNNSHIVQNNNHIVLYPPPITPIMACIRQHIINGSTCNILECEGSVIAINRNHTIMLLRDTIEIQSVANVAYGRSPRDANTVILELSDPGLLDEITKIMHIIEGDHPEETDDHPILRLFYPSTHQQ